jgi:choline-sulfatase
MMQVTASFGFHDVYEILGRTAARYSSDPHTRYLDERGLLQRLREDHSYRTQQPVYYATPSVLPEEDFLDTHIGRKSVEWIQHYDRSQPFFLWTSWAGPHDPWDAPGKYGSMYDPADMPASIVDDLSAKPDIQQKKAERQRMQTCTEQDIRRARAQYCGLVTLIDDQIGQILAALEERGLLNSTVVVYTSDHGEMMGDHGLFQKEQFYEPSVRVPLVVRFPPEFGQGIKSDALVELIDLMPTFLATAGSDIPEACLGRSLLPILKGVSHEHRDVVFSELGPIKMVRTSRYKYTYTAKRGGLELYDLHTDPQELTNLVNCAQYAGVQGEMERRILDWLISTERHLNSKGKVRDHRLQ